MTKVDTPCVETTWWRLPRGYGRASIGGRKVFAHRHAWEQAHGPIPDGMVVCHRCDNPPCINVGHLFLGTIADNNADMVAKGRVASGERNGSLTRPEKRPRGAGHRNAKLSDPEVMEIRRLKAAGVVASDIAPMFGIAPSAVHLIANGERWAHLPLLPNPDGRRKRERHGLPSERTLEEAGND